MSETPMQALERKVDELVRLCAEMNQENARLKANAKAWKQEREELINKNENAQQKVSSIIDRLQRAEQGQ